MRCTELKPGRRFDVLLNYGEEINQALRDLARREHVETAMVTAGLGGFDKFALDYSGMAGQRWNNCVLQLASVQGMITNGEPQIHAVVTLDGREGITRVGRVAEGCTRLFYCQMLVQELCPVEPEV